jgi:hypothetical protein
MTSGPGKLVETDSALFDLGAVDGQTKSGNVHDLTSLKNGIEQLCRHRTVRMNVLRLAGLLFSTRCLSAGFEEGGIHGSQDAPFERTHGHIGQRRPMSQFSPAEWLDARRALLSALVQLGKPLPEVLSGRRQDRIIGWGIDRGPCGAGQLVG